MVECLPSRLRLRLLLVAVLSRQRRQSQAAVLLEQRQGRVRSARPPVAGRPPLHLVHSLGHGRQGSRRRVGVQVRGRAEEGVLVKPVGRGGGGVRGLPPKGTTASCLIEGWRHHRLLHLKRHIEGSSVTRTQDEDTAEGAPLATSGLLRCRSELICVALNTSAVSAG